MTTSLWVRQVRCDINHDDYYDDNNNTTVLISPVTLPTLMACQCTHQCITTPAL